MQIVAPGISSLRQALAEGWAMANATRGVSIGSIGSSESMGE